jgi:hypothetical protein
MMLQWMHNKQANASTNNQYELQPEADLWKIAHKSLNIDYKRIIGKGAFSIVYSGTEIILRARRALCQIRKAD